MKRVVVLALVALALLVVAVVPAFAGTTTFTGTLTESHPIYPIGRPDDSACDSVLDDLLPEKYRYHLMNVMVTETGTYSYKDNQVTIDIEVAVFDGPFDPNNPLNNCISSMDDIGAVALEAGKQYILAVTSYDIPTTGDYEFSLTGPGIVYEGTLNSIVVDPCLHPLPDGSVVRSLPAGAPAFWSPSLEHATGFNIPAGTWWTTGTEGDFTHLWIACQAETVWVPTNAVGP